MSSQLYLPRRSTLCKHLLLDKAVVDYLLNANVNCITSTDIASFYRDSNNTHQVVKKGGGKESKGISRCFSASLMKPGFYSLVL